MKQRIEQVVAHQYGKPGSKNEYMVKVLGEYTGITAWCTADNLTDKITSLIYEVQHTEPEDY